MKAIAKKSLAAKAKTKAEHTRELVLAMLEWSEDKYGAFVMEKAHEYLKRQCGPDAYGIDLLMQSKIFWSWWKNQWYLRDDVFLSVWADSTCFEELCDSYELLHSAQNLHIRPNKVVMELSYAKMIAALIDGKEAVK